MRLLEYPYVILMEIVKHFDYPEMFILSLTNKKFHVLIRHLRYQNVKSIRYLIKGSRADALIETRDEKKIFMIAVEEDSNFDNGERIYIGDLSGTVGFHRLVGKTYSYLHLSYPESSDPSTPTTFQNHIEGLFRHCAEVRLEFDVKANSTFLPEHKTVQESVLKGEEIEGQFLDQFFEKYPNQKIASIWPLLTGELKNNSKMYDVPTLCVWKSNFMATHIMDRFTGRHLVLQDAMSTEHDIVQFLRTWSSGEAYEHLVTLRLYPDYKKKLFEREYVHDQVVGEPYHPARRPQYYAYNVKVHLETSELMAKQVNCERFVDIRRETDGKLASYVVDLTSFNFFVWEELSVQTDNSD